MKQQINLYLRLSPPKPTPFALYGIAGACALVLVAYLLATGYYYRENSQLTAQLTDAQLKNRNLQSQMDRLQASDKAVELAPLEQRLEQLRQQHQIQQILIGFLKDSSRFNTGGFSSAMMGLARQHVTGVEVQTFELKDRGAQLSLTGKVARPQSLPIYIARLGNEAAFNSLKFQKIRIEEVEGALEFKVASLAGSDT